MIWLKPAFQCLLSGQAINLISNHNNPQSGNSTDSEIKILSVVSKILLLRAGAMMYKAAMHAMRYPCNSPMLLPFATAIPLLTEISNRITQRICGSDSLARRITQSLNHHIGHIGQIVTVISSVAMIILGFSVCSNLGILAINVGYCLATA